VDQCNGRLHFSHPGDVSATAFTRAKNRAISDLIGAGEISAEEAIQETGQGGRERPARRPAATASAPAAPPAEGEETGEIINDKQVKAIHAMLKDIFGEDEEAQVKWMAEIEPSAVTGTKIHLRTGEKVVTKAQASRIITALNDERDSRQGGGS
jgi:hypothetical protein